MLRIIDKDLAGLIFAIGFFLFAVISFYYVWFRDGANKASRNVLKFFNQNAPGSVTRLEKISAHPLNWKFGSILFVLAGLLAIFLACRELL